MHAIISPVGFHFLLLWVLKHILCLSPVISPVALIVPM